MRPAAAPRIEWPAVALGLAVALAIGWLGPRAAPIFGLAAPFLGVAGGAFLAGKRAFRAPVYQGTLVGVGYVLAEAIGLVRGPLLPAEGTLADTAVTIVSDLALLVLAAASAILARASSSSDTGRGR
jgi:hypothetical protein